MTTARRPMRPLTKGAAQALTDRLLPDGVRVEIDATGHVQLWPMRDVTTRTEVRALAAVLAATDSPVDWNRRNPAGVTA